VGLLGVGLVDGFSLVVVLPAAAASPAPLGVMQNFCGNKAALPDLDTVVGPRRGIPKRCANPVMGALAPLIFGDAIMEPPIEQLLRAGYGVAMMYGGDVAPDEAAEAPPFLAALTPAGTPSDERTGAVAAWAWSYLRAIDVLAADARIDAGASCFGDTVATARRPCWLRRWTRVRPPSSLCNRARLPPHCIIRIAVRRSPR
jgi:hypothetical protein